MAVTALLFDVLEGPEGVLVNEVEPALAKFAPSALYLLDVSQVDAIEVFELDTVHFASKTLILVPIILVVVLIKLG